MAGLLPLQRLDCGIPKHLNNPSGTANRLYLSVTKKAHVGLEVKPDFFLGLDPAFDVGDRDDDAENVPRFIGREIARETRLSDQCDSAS